VVLNAHNGEAYTQGFYVSAPMKIKRVKTFKIITMERCECELFIEKYFGLNTLNTTEKTEIKTDFGQLVNALVMFSEERAEANVGTSGKDLRVCEVIDRHLNVLRQDPFRSSVQYFLEKGTVSGSFLLALRGLLKEYDEICQAAK
jgi:hypothetical protein